jgi:hypothetical protein
MRMRKSRRTVIPLVVFALVAAGGTAAGLGLGLGLVANAQTAIGTPCTSSTSPTITCTLGDSTEDTTVTSPSTIQAVVTLDTSSTTSSSTSTSTTSAPSDLYVQLQYSVLCFQGNDNTTTSQPASPDDEYAITSSVTENLTLGYANPDSCEVVTLTATLETSSDDTTFTPATTGSFTMSLQYTPASTSSSSAPSSVNVPYISGYGSKCIDDRGNSSSSGAQVIIWGCNHGDSAQDWTWSSYELKHDGKCVNDPGYGGSGTKLILYSCTGSSNEKWSHVSYGEFKLYYTGKGQLCLDDPGYSTSNGTRLMVYKCNNGSNQHWSRS